MGIDWLSGNRLTLLDSGGEYFPALLAAIAAARREVYLETYIFADDHVGRAVITALIDAARRGVAVRVLADGFGARDFPEEQAEVLSAAGVQALFYRPEIARFRFRRHRLRRLHRKLAVIDGLTGFVGGINVIADDNSPADLGPRFDYAARVEGPVVAQMHRAVERMWQIVAWASLRHRYRIRRTRRPAAPAVGEQRAAFLVRDNIRHRHDIANAYLEAIHAAREEILLANAYFLPGLRFRHALRAAARRGVRVTILLQGQSDHALMHFATQALYDALLKEGIRVFEYRRGFLHAKVAVIDGNWATVGSSNIDPFSLLLAKEANLVARDPVFAGQLRASLLAAMREGAVELKPDDLEKMPWHSRLRRWLSYGLVRLLLGLSGYGQRHLHADGGDEFPTS